MAHKLIAEGEVLRARGKVHEALMLFQRAMESQPSNAALTLIGTCWKQLGNSDKALECYAAVLATDPTDWCANNNTGVILKERGDLSMALTSYMKAIEHGPDKSISHENIAVVLTDIGSRFKIEQNLQGAIAKYSEALHYNSNYAAAHFNLGVVYSELGQFQDSLRHYERAVQCNPQYVEALSNTGVLFKNSGNLAKAIDYYERALRINPNFTIANNNLAIALTDFGTQHYKRALAFNATYSPAWYNLGVAFAEQGNSDEAIVAYQMAVTFNPKCAEALNNLGVVFKDRGNLDKSIYYYGEALKACPNFAQTLNNLGVIYTMLGKLDEAYEFCRKAIQSNPNYAEAYNNLGVLYRDEGLIEEAIRSYKHTLTLDARSRNAGQNMLLALNSQLGADSEAVYAEHMNWGVRFSREFTPLNAWLNERRTDRQLRIGYLSADFFTHSVSYFIEAPLKHHDKQRTQVFCYSNVQRRDAKTAYLERLADVWRHVHGKSTTEVAELIVGDKIDVLVELTGHTAGNRLDVMALRPAPIGVTWIGYPNTTGLPTIQYRITDSIVDPVDTKQKFSESLVRLPGPFLCYTPSADAPPVSPSPAEAGGFVTFGSFNNLAKVNDRVMQVWAAVLNAVPNSRFLMKCKPFASPTVRAKMLQHFQQLGVDASRIDLMPLVPTTIEHLRTYNLVDISLDTFPYAGTTTTCEALFMGIPVVTLRASQPLHAQNVGVSLLSHIQGMSSFVASSEEEFVKTAVAAASDIKMLADLRSRLRQMMLGSPVCDGKTFVRGLEDAYTCMFRRWVESEESSEESPRSDEASPVPMSLGEQQQHKDRQQQEQQQRRQAQGDQRREEAGGGRNGKQEKQQEPVRMEDADPLPGPSASAAAAAAAQAAAQPKRPPTFAAAAAKVAPGISLRSGKRTA